LFEKGRHILNSNFKVIDSHAHIYPEKIAKKASEAIGRFYELPMLYTGTSSSLIENGKKINTEKYLVCSVATSAAQVTVINDYIIAECIKHKQFVGLAAMHQDFVDVEEEIERTFSKGLKGIKMHHDFQMENLDDSRFFKTYKKCEEMGIVCLLHAGDDRYEYTSPYRFANILERFPDLKCIAAHFGGYKRWEEAYKSLKGIDNLYFDTSSSLYALKPDEATDIIKAFGIEKFMFGTDFPMWDHEKELERFLNLSLTGQEKQMILYDNFINLFSY